MNSFECFRLCLTVAFMAQTALMIQLSFINRVISDAIVLKSYTAKASDFIWFQEVTEHPSSTNLRVFIRSHYKDFTSTTPQHQRIEDPNLDLELKAIDEQNLQCVLFYKKSQQIFFIHRFPFEQQQKQPIQLSEYMLEWQQNIESTTFKLSSTCDRLIINNKMVYIYNQQYYYNEDEYSQGNITNSFWWNLAVNFQDYDTIIQGHDLEFSILVVDGDVYSLNFDFQVDYYLDEDDNYVQNGYTYSFYSFITYFDIANFTIEVKQKFIDTSFFQDRSTFNQRIIIFGYQEFTNTFNFTLISIHLNEDEANIVSEEEGQAKTKPTFISSQDMKRAIVYGVRPDGTQFYVGYHYYYGQQIGEVLQLPPVITQGKWHLIISNQFLYARTAEALNNNFNESAYKFAKEKFYPYFEQTPIRQSSYNNNWIYSFIKPLNSVAQTSFLKAQMTVYHVHESNERIYYRTQEINSFLKTQMHQFSSFFDMNFFVHSPQDPNQVSIISALSGYRWIYALENKKKQDQSQQTTIYVITYDRQNRQTINITVKLPQIEEFEFKKYMTSRAIDCFYVQDLQNQAINLYKTNGTNIQFIDFISLQEHQQDFPSSDKQIIIGQNCSMVKLFQKIYSIKKGPNPPHYKQLNIHPLDIHTSSFDYNMVFAIQGQNLYKFNGQSYDQIFTYPFMQNNQILPSPDGNKLIIRTHKSVSEQITNETNNKTYSQTYQSFDLITLLYQNGQWVHIKPQNNLTEVRITNFISTLQISTNFNRTIICYNTTKQQKICLLSLTNYTELKAYQSVYQFKNDRIPKIINVKEKLIFIVDASQLIRNKQTYQYDCAQNLFEVRNNSIRLLNNYQVQCKLYHDDFLKRQVFQNHTQRSFHLLIEIVNKKGVILLNTTDKSLQIINLYPKLQHLHRGFFYSNGSFYECQPGCLQCQNFYFCTKCMSGYTLSLQTTACVKCDGYCDICDTNNVANCFTCPLGFYYNKTSIDCSKCHPNCQSCTGRSIGKCTSCKIGYFLNNNIEKKKRRTCISCPFNCDYCSNSTFCTSCQFGFSASVNGSCIKCPLDCSICDSVEITKCLSCRRGFEFVTVNGKQQCQKCPDFCAECQNGKCTQCFGGLHLDIEKNACRKKCWTPCNQCSLVNPHQCLSCIIGYKLNGISCIPDLSCSANSSCISCPSGYFLLSKKCHQCAFDQNCAQCHLRDPTKCVSCKEGFFLVDNTCQSCITENCVRCYSTNICQQCKEGYFNSQMNSSASHCIKCRQNCKSCVQSATNCLSCNEDYSLTGSVCISVKIVIFNLKLNIQVSKFTADTFNQVIQQLAILLNKSESQVRITSLRIGSVSVNGSVDVKNTTDQQNILSRLDQGLSVGLMIAGQQVLQSAFVGYTPVPVIAQQQIKSNTVVILATVIPGGLSNFRLKIVVVLLIMFIVYKKCFEEPTVVQRQQSDRSTETDASDNIKKKKEKKIGRINKNMFGTSHIQTKRKVQFTSSIQELSRLQ